MVLQILLVWAISSVGVSAALGLMMRTPGARAVGVQRPATPHLRLVSNA